MKIKQECQENNVCILKIVKQPLFLGGVVAIFCSILIAIVGTVINPSQSNVINKYAKALQNRDGNLLSECYSPQVSKDELTWMINVYELTLNALDLTGKVQVEYLVGDEQKNTLEDGREVTYIPAIRVIKVGDKVKKISLDGKTLIDVDGKQYFYTGKE